MNFEKNEQYNVAWMEYHLAYNYLIENKRTEKAYEFFFKAWKNLTDVVSQLRQEIK